MVNFDPIPRGGNNSSPSKSQGSDFGHFGAGRAPRIVTCGYKITHVKSINPSFPLPKKERKKERKKEECRSRTIADLDLNRRVSFCDILDAPHNLGHNGGKRIPENKEIETKKKERIGREWRASDAEKRTL